MNLFYGEKIITAGTAIAFQLAQECSSDDLALLGALFNVIGDQLGLLSVTKSQPGNGDSNQTPPYTP